MRETWLIDGYNVLGETGGQEGTHSLAHARDRLTDRLADFAGFLGIQCVLVFDAHRRSDALGERRRLTPNLEIAYTKVDQTADAYIERECFERVRSGERVRVCTNDGVEQQVILASGGLRVSVRELNEQMAQAQRLRREQYQRGGKTRYLFTQISEEAYEKMERIRLGDEPKKGG